MDARVEPAFEETKRLQRCINDLTSLLALPAIWSGRDPAGILRTLTDALFGMLHLDFVYGRFTDASGDAPIEMTRAQKSETQPEEFSQALRQWLKVEPAKWPRSMRDPAGEDDISILPLRLGLSGEFGMVVAGARRADFPRDTERLILSVAANQASIGLQEAQRSREQKRLAVDLDRQVARRTKELAEANEALKREFGERARTEEILRRRELDFRLIVDSIPVPVAVTMPTGEVEGLNQPALDYFGKTPDELKQWSADVVHPDDLQRMIAAYRAAHETGHTYNVECRHRRADGAYRWFKVIGLPLRDPQGGILRWLHLQIDIEDRKRAEIHLAGEKQILEMIASGRPLRDVLETLCRFFEGAADDCFCGLSPIDSRSKTYQYGVAPSLPASYTDPVEGALVSTDDSPRGRAVQEKTQVIAEDMESDARWTAAPCRPLVLEHGVRAIWSTPICSREGSVIGTFCVYQQKPGIPTPRHQELIAHLVQFASIAIERSQAEDELRRSEFYLTEGQRIGATGTFSWKIDTDEIKFSEELHRIFEFEPNTTVTFDMIRGRNHPDDLPKLAANVAQVRAGHDNPDFETRLIMPDRRIKYMWVCARVIRHEDGRPECLGVVQDITRRKMAEEARDKVRSELAHVSRVVSLGALTASIAHEVNQPLASIVTNGETGLRWLARAEPDLEKVRDLTTRVVNDARRAADIIDRIRTMASRGTSKQSLVPLDDIIRDSMSFLEHEFQSKAVSVSLDLAPGLPMVLGDRTQLQQVIVNLAVNAVQAMTSQAPRKLGIRTQRTDVETVCCIVEDSGAGIDAAHLPRLFDSFFTTKETGMGLGLPIVQSIIEAHDGRILADNDSALGGARIIFELPVCLSGAKLNPAAEISEVKEAPAPAEASTSG